jgi:uncharacterized protein
MAIGGRDMELRDSEKLILLMLSEIYQHLKIKGEIDPKFVKETIFSGNYWGFEWQYSGIFGSEPAKESAVRETCDVLDMYSALKHSYDRLSQEEKKKLETDNSISEDNITFPGFDANNEDHYGIAHYLINSLDRFTTFKGRNLNSHSHSIEIYHRMLSAFMPMRATMDPGLTANQIATIMHERIHPSRR